MLKQKSEASLNTLYWDFKKIPFTLYAYGFTKILKSGASFIQKTDSLLKNSHEGFEQLQT